MYPLLRTRVPLLGRSKESSLVLFCVAVLAFSVAAEEESDTSFSSSLFPSSVTASFPSYWQPVATFSSSGLSLGPKDEQFLPASSLSPSSSPLEVAAYQFCAQQLGRENVPNNTVKSFSFSDPGTGLYHLHLSQSLNGVPIDNAGVQVVVGPGESESQRERVVTWTSTWANVSSMGFGSEAAQKGAPSLSPLSAVQSFARALGMGGDGNGTSPELELVEEKEGERETRVKGASFALGGEVPVTLKYLQTPDRTLELVWSLEVEMPNNWLNAFVNAETGDLVAVTDWTSHSSVPRFSTSSSLQAEGAERDEEALSGERKEERNLGNAITIGSMELLLPPRSARSSSSTPVRGGGQTGRHLFASLSAEQILKAEKERIRQGDSDDLLTFLRRERRERKRKLQEGIRDVSYRVIPIGQNSLLEGDRQLITDPQDLSFSPKGWHDLGQGPVGETTGANVLAFDNPDNLRDVRNNDPAVSATFSFDFPVDDKLQEPPQYRDASITNMFFVSNAVHDIYSAYGFNAQTGSFEGNDPVIATAQDGSGKNNAVFAAPPDGRPGRMRMFLFNRVQPERDGALSNDVVIHELTHGLSSRLTGGPANANCLSSAEAGGMGEGWSDFFGVVLGMKATNKRDDSFAVGAYVTGKANGIRTAPYSTSLQVNPLTFSALKERKRQEVHAIGEIWASLLMEVYWNLVDKLGFSANVKSAQSGKGNTVTMQLVIDGMKLQPCNPTFVQARDAILAAETQRTKGANQCEIWKGFAKRGLGFSASDRTKDDAFDLPPECSK